MFNSLYSIFFTVFILTANSLTLPKNEQLELKVKLKNASEQRSEMSYENYIFYNNLQNPEDISELTSMEVTFKSQNKESIEKTIHKIKSANAIQHYKPIELFRANKKHGSELGKVGPNLIAKERALSRSGMSKVVDVKKPSWLKKNNIKKK